MTGTAALVAVAGALQLTADAGTRCIDEIIVHCSATPAGRDVGASDIKVWHLQRGFADIGYHYVVRLDGTIEIGRPLHMTGAHCKGHNARSIGVCYIGGCDAAMRPADTRTAAQRESLALLIDWLRKLFPGAKVSSHRDYAAKACPSFDATTEYKEYNSAK